MSRRAPHEGTVRRRADGRYEAILHVGYRNGKRVRKSFYGKKRRDVQKRLVAALRDLQLGIAPEDDRLTLQAHLERWLASVKPALRPSTHRRYSQLVRLHIAPALGRTPLGKLTAQQVQRFLNGKL